MATKKPAKKTAAKAKPAEKKKAATKSPAKKTAPAKTPAVQKTKPERAPAQDGALTPLWSVPVEGRASGPMLAAGDKVVVAQHYLGCPGSSKHLLCLDPATGKTTWSLSLTAEQGLPRQLAASASVVVVQTSGDLTLGVELASGKVSWERTIAVPQGGWVLPFGVRVVGDQLVYAVRPLAGPGSELVLCDATLAERTRFPLDLEAPDQLFVAGDTAVVKHPGGLTAFRLSTGARAWDVKGVKLLAHDATSVLAAEPKEEGRVVCLELATGAERWSITPPDSRTPYAGAIGEGVAATLFGGALVTSDLATGAQKSLTTEAFMEWSQLTIARGRVWVGGELTTRSFDVESGVGAVGEGTTARLSPGRGFVSVAGVVVTQELDRKRAVIRGYRA